MRWDVAILLLLAVTVVHAAQLLAAPFEQRIGTVTVYADQRIDQRIASERMHADGLLRVSPIYTGALDRLLFLTDVEATAPALVYYDARRRVAADLGAKGRSVDAFFAGG